MNAVNAVTVTLTHGQTETTRYEKNFILLVQRNFIAEKNVSFAILLHQFVRFKRSDIGGLTYALVLSYGSCKK